MDGPITRAEHEEFRRSMELANKNLFDENKRQNKRLDILEKGARENTAMIANVERLAVNMENMLKVQEKQGERLEALESRDGKMWRKAVGYIITAIIGAALGLMFTKLGI